MPEEEGKADIFGIESETFTSGRRLGDHRGWLPPAGDAIIETGDFQRAARHSFQMRTPGSSVGGVNADGSR